MMNYGRKGSGIFFTDSSELKDIVIPLTSLQYDIQIVNAISNITLTQIYTNNTDKFLELQYNFPINPNVCVYRFFAIFGNKRIQGIVKQKQQAKAQYIQALNQGKNVVYGEIKPEQKNILTFKIGNIPPKQNIKIQLVYLQQLTVSLNTFYKLQIPGQITSKYFNHISLQDIKLGYKNTKAKTQGKFYWDFKISVKSTRKIIHFDSNTHEVDILTQNHQGTYTTFSINQQAILNKDFSFSYTTQDFMLPSCVLGRSDSSSTAMISFIPKFCSLALDDAYKASILGKSYETDIQSAKGEYIFLLDRSGSMSGQRIQKAKQALILFIKSLPQDTYFNVVSFGSGVSNLFNNSQKYIDKEINKAIQNIKLMQANMGGTQIYSPLLNILNNKPIEGYPKQIFLLTDGEVENTELVIQMIGLNNKYARVHTIGIGNGTSEKLIVEGAKSGKGLHVFITDEEDPSQKIIQLLTDSLSPVISKMKLVYDKQIVQSIIPNPESLPYVLKGQLVNFYINFKGQLEKKAIFKFSYEDSMNKLPYQSELVVDHELPSESFVDRMGHFKRIKILQDSHRNNTKLQDMIFYVKSIDKKQQIINLSVKHQILSQFTAFICVQKQLIDGVYQQVKDKGQIKLSTNQLQQKKHVNHLINYPTYQVRAVNYPAFSTHMNYPNNSGCITYGYSPFSNHNSLFSNNISSPVSTYSNASTAYGTSLTTTYDNNNNAYGISSTTAAYGTNSITPTAFSTNSTITYGSNNNAYGISSTTAAYGTNSITPTAFSTNSTTTYGSNNNAYGSVNSVSGQSPFSFSTTNYVNKPNINFNNSPQAKPTISAKKEITRDILSIINAQTSQGAWDDLMAKWIQKHNPQKKYSLVAKKGIIYSKKSKNFIQFSSQFAELVK